MEGDEIVVAAKAYAKSVEIQNENQDLLLSDNYFDMNAGETRVKVLSGSTEGLRLRSVYDICLLYTSPDPGSSAGAPRSPAL